MDKYLEAEKRLAELMGYEITLVGNSLSSGVPTIFGKLGESESMEVSQWCRDWNACGPLMVEQGVEVRYFDNGKDGCYNIKGKEYFSEEPDYHPDKNTAVRYGVVMAVIAKLEAQHES